MRRPFADGSGEHPELSDEARVELAEAALADQAWGRARELWQQLACAVPQNKQFRAQLMFARAGELLAAGEAQRAREELERVLRVEPDHAGAKAMLKAARGGRISRLLGL
jgi:hypothetical protein